MVGIVVVSHSRALAEAALQLALQMAGDQPPPVRLAAGAADGELGTDATAVSAALEELGDQEGVVVLADLGSALLSAEMALEFIDPELAQRTTISGAPLVEGLVTAVVAAGSGASAADVVAELDRVAAGKAAQVQPSAAGAADGEPLHSAGQPAADAVVAELEVTPAHGLHARPAAAWVRLVREHDAQVQVENLTAGTGPVRGDSLTSIAMLGARRGHQLRITATGPQAEDLVAALTAFARAGFGDEPEATATEPEPTGWMLQVPGSGLDIAMGPALVRGGEVDLSGYEPSADEHQRLSDAIAAVTGELQELILASHGETAMILTAQLELLDDPALREGADEAIAAGENAAQAWADGLLRIAERYAALPDSYQAARDQDVLSVRDQVLQALLGAAEDTGAPMEHILVVDQLDAISAAGLDGSITAGVITRRGGATGHGVIVARSRGIPVFTDAEADHGATLRAMRSGMRVAFDLRGRQMVADLDEGQRRAYTQEIGARAKALAVAEAEAGEPARTQDGTTVLVMGNVGSRGDAEQVGSRGADGSGLVRTELVFGHRQTAPSVAEQVTELSAIAAAVGGPVTVRTWDVGADKPLAYHHQDPEQNPFLGVRGLRSFRNNPGLLDDQLEAICRVAADHPIDVMFPMITTRAEVDWALERLAGAAERAGHRPRGVGIMIEVPAAALKIADLSAGLDFVSIGTNDLTQYACAAERGNAGVADLGDVRDPGVLRLIEMVCAEVSEGCLIAVCGDAASQPDLAEQLVRFGVRELSATAPAVPLIKQIIRGLDLS